MASPYLPSQNSTVPQAEGCCIIGKLQRKACQGMGKSHTGLAPWQSEKTSNQPDSLSSNLETGQPGSMPPKKVLCRMAARGESSYLQSMPEHFRVEGRS